MNSSLRICLRFLLLAAAALTASLTSGQEKNDSPAKIDSITTSVIHRNREGETGTTWFHPRACRVPGAEGKSEIFMNLQVIAGSDYFGPVHWQKSGDNAASWTKPEPVDALGRVPVEGHPGLEAGVCDVVPQYHPPSQSILCLGHVVFYRGPRFSSKEQLSRFPVYSVRRKDGSWSERKILKWDDPRGSFIYTNNCGQRVTLENGDVILALTFGAKSEARMVAGARCSFDGETLAIRKVGQPLENSTGRGLLEPSVTRFQDKFYITLRAEDGHGYVSTSDDGINYAKQQAWKWDDGTDIGMSTTQQHWLTHSDGLFLVYTRKDEKNENVIRWRAPLWVAQVDPDTLRLIRDTERVVFPLHGDGVNTPDKVPLMGNFHVTNISPEESIITVGEWLPRNNAQGDLLMARIAWSKPNRHLP